MIQVLAVTINAVASDSENVFFGLHTKAAAASVTLTSGGHRGLIPIISTTASTLDMQDCDSISHAEWAFFIVPS
jgi:hypothetical protein